MPSRLLINFIKVW